MVTDEEVKNVEKLLDNRPFRRFDFKTPLRVQLENIACIS
jgi:IS30 family transposase